MRIGVIPETRHMRHRGGPMSNYVCPEHKTPVTWRGTGCATCEHERRYGRPRVNDNGLTGAHWDRWRDQHAATHTLEVPQ